jgi:hypothetical protein
MIVLKKQSLINSYDYFSRNGHFNLELFIKLLTAKGINPEEQIEVIKRSKNIKTK